MSYERLSRSGDLKLLLDDGFQLSLEGALLVVHHVPYLNSRGEVAYGQVVTELDLAADVTVKPGSHVAYFVGEAPCGRDGQPLDKVINSSGRQLLGDGFAVDHTLSSKPAEGYADYYDKITTYVAMIAGPAEATDATATARTYLVATSSAEDPSLFQYLDTASTRAGIATMAAKLALPKVAIIGLGGTGAYILDHTVTTPVEEIHLYDGDRFLQHNAFRSPGAASIEDLQGAPMKVDYYTALYSRLRRHGLVPHAYYVDPSNLEELRGFDFIFLALDDATAKKPIVEALQEFGIDFIDVGMGLYEADGALAGTLRVTTSTTEQRDHVWDRDRIPFPTEKAGEDDYDRNIQISELNGLNAALAVIRWKKRYGFYHDLGHEYFSTYDIDGNHITNDEVE